jgi:hypothetical protein
MQRSDQQPHSKMPLGILVTPRNRPSFGADTFVDAPNREPPSRSRHIVRFTSAKVTPRLHHPPMEPKPITAEVKWTQNLCIRRPVSFHNTVLYPFVNICCVFFFMGVFICVMTYLCAVLLKMVQKKTCPPTPVSAYPCCFLKELFWTQIPKQMSQ